jgi:hypothetical protein
MRHPEFQNVKAIYFDAGSTLITEIPCYKKRIKDTIKENQLSIKESDFFALILEGSEASAKPL